MKNLLKVAAASGLLCLLSIMPAVAQIVNAVEFTTAFPFYAANTKMPAGSYRITPSSYNSQLLLIESTTGTHSAFIEYLPTQAESGHATTDVSFKKYGTAEFLNRIWVGGQTFGMQIEPTKVEAKLAAGAQPEVHSVTGKGK
jgi:hypothetical protein